MSSDETLKTVSKVIAEACPGAELEAKEASRPLLLVINTKHPMRTDHAQNMRDQLKNSVKGPPLEGVPVIVCAGGVSIDLIEDPRSKESC